MTALRSAGPAAGDLDDRALGRAFRALGNPHRVTIVRALLARAFACCDGPRVDQCRFDPASCNVGDLAKLVDVAPSTVSRHLKELEDAGLIERARDGRYLYCRVSQTTIDHLAAFLTGGDAASESAA